jgi:hypothetical protein
MITAKEIRIQAKEVRSLCWVGDRLVDWVGGGRWFTLDGVIYGQTVNYAFNFDAAITSPSGAYSAIFTRLGTKGLLLERGRIIRELNRSFYHANAYEYPIALLRLADGREVIAHCPDHYNQLEIDDLETGNRLTTLASRQPSDYFFSRLAASADGRFLLSAGWHWHPMDRIKVFSLERALQDAAHLDGTGIGLELWAENSSASFLGPHQLVAWLYDEFDYERYEDEAEGFFERQKEGGILRSFDLNTQSHLSTCYPSMMVGTVMPVGTTHVVGFYGHPKLFELKDGQMTASWPHLYSGKQQSSIIWGALSMPSLAIDAVHNRFALSDDNGITVVQFAL